VFLGDQLLEYLLLALGGALLVGNVLALLRPPARTKDGDLVKAPVGRSLVMALVGFIAALWAVGSIVRG
jgi:hypothetical protein